MSQKKSIKQKNRTCFLLKNKLVKIGSVVVGLILIIGILFAIALNLFAPMGFFCTAKTCNPPADTGYFEVQCNDCGGEGTYFFFTGIINFKKICPGKEIMIFNDGEYIDRRIDIEECKYVLHTLR
ncbi:MAG: hypothetical protein ACLFN8_02680 [Candidatus Woesearchaeota archaeon]